MGKKLIIKKCKMKWILILTLILTSVGVASAIEICGDTTELVTSCRLITPPLSCPEYNFTILNMSQNTVYYGNLTIYYVDLYYLDLNLSEGGYIVRLCDNSSMGISVEKEDDKMIIGAIIITPLLLALLFLIAAATLSEEHSHIKIFLFLLSVPLFFTSLHFGLIAIIEFYGMEELQEAIGSTSYWISWVFAIIITYFIIIFLMRLLEYAAQKKKKRLEY